MSYFDTAYLLKCYVKEDGWEAVRALPPVDSGSPAPSMDAWSCSPPCIASCGRES